MFHGFLGQHKLADRQRLQASINLLTKKTDTAIRLAVHDHSDFEVQRVEISICRTLLSLLNCMTFIMKNKINIKTIYATHIFWIIVYYIQHVWRHVQSPIAVFRTD